VVVAAMESLAEAVIRQAVKDLTKPGEIGVQAQNFIDSENLTPWAQALCINPDLVRFKAKKITQVEGRVRAVI